MTEKITTIEEEMRRSYMDYAMSVIVGRSLPDVRDGLKPVQRRILYSMYEMNLTHDKPYKKCARIVGEVMGKYHPHGDLPIYDALVHMAQKFSLRYPLIEGQGNFGSIDGDPPAAMRYTEARLMLIAGEMLEDIEKETVEKTLNFDGSLNEPMLLPSKIPNLLINGASGIAVGMATKMPPHNISEILNAIIYYIDHQDCSIADLLNYVKAPDFPTGGVIIGLQSLQKAYYTGRGSFKIRSRYHVEKHGANRYLVFTEIPYEVNKSELLRKISTLTKEAKLNGVMAIKDESNKDGIRIVIKLKKDANTKLVLNQLYERTSLEIAYHIINLALVDNVPKVLNLKTLIAEFVKFRMEVVIKRSKFDLKKAEHREHIVSGLLKALDRIDEIISTIKASTDTNSAREKLVKTFGFTPIQAKAILEMRLQKLTGLEQKNLEKEEQELKKLITKLHAIMENETLRYKIIKDELRDILKKYGDSRKTEISEEEIEKRSVEDLIPSENVVIVVSRGGYIKRISMKEYRIQRRGGVGILTDTNDQDYITQLFIANTHDTILFFSNKGKVYKIKTYTIPKSARRAHGKALINFIKKLEPEERIQSAVKISNFEHFYVLFVTKQGVIKKTPLEKFKNIRANGIRAINLRKSDELVSIKIIDGTSDIFIGTRFGKVLRMSAQQLRSLGRNSTGVRGIKLKPGDSVIGCALDSEGSAILTISEFGKGKRTKLDKFRTIRKGGVGEIGHKITSKTGKIVDILCVQDKDQLLIITKHGYTIKIKVSVIPVTGRNTEGVKLISLKKEDSISAVTKLEY